jgi:hypothetical protein
MFPVRPTRTRQPFHSARPGAFAATQTAASPIGAAEGQGGRYGGGWRAKNRTAADSHRVGGSIPKFFP